MWIAYSNDSPGSKFNLVLMIREKEILHNEILRIISKHHSILITNIL